MYLVKTPWWLRALYPSYIWRIPNNHKVIYLTFDDGPHETATPFVLNTLQQYQAKATFFCIGKNVRLYPAIYNQILTEGHRVGNHTENHLNGWKVSDEDYVKDIKAAAEVIDSSLFRPPYGRIRRRQGRKIQDGRRWTVDRGPFEENVLPPSSSSPPSTVYRPPSILMWDVLSGDFDLSLSPEDCLQNVLKYTNSGSIVVFHDSSKAWDKMSYALPRMLAYFTEKGFRFEVLP